MKLNPDKFLIIKPAKIPIFYGYIIVVVGTIGILASLPGQTVGVSTFTDPVKDALGLSRNQISMAYMLGTLGSSLFLGLAGKWYDRFGARRVAFYSALGLMFTLFLCSHSEIISCLIKALTGVNHFIVPLSLMIVLFFMLRFSGQGVLTLVSRNMIMKWFDKMRGRVNAFSSIAVSLGFSASPIWISFLIDEYNWQGAWRWMSLGLLVFIVIILLFYKDNPEEYGLLPDGSVEVKSNENSDSKIKKQFTLKEALQLRIFWVYSLTLSFYSFFVTGFTFHVISIFKNAGIDANKAVSIFVPISVVSVVVSLIANFISDWINLKLLLNVKIAGGILACMGLLYLAYPFGIYVLIGGVGVMTGLFSVLVTVAWPRFFGRKYLGAISGKTMSMIVLASSIGPYLFSISNSSISYFFPVEENINLSQTPIISSYALVALLGIIFLIIVFLTSFKTINPQV